MEPNNSKTLKVERGTTKKLDPAHDREEPRQFIDEEFLIINGRVLEDFHLFERKGSWSLRLWNEADSEMLIGSPFSDIEKYFNDVELPCFFEWNELVSIIKFTFKDRNQETLNRLRFEFGFDLDNWARPYSPAEYVKFLGRAATDLRLGLNLYNDDQEIETQNFGLECCFESTEKIVGEEISEWAGRVKTICELTEKNLLRSVRKDSLVTFFDFPASMKTACQQYLLYFAQFLADLGISAESELKEEAGQVLFSVTPRDGASALGKIKEALEAYLDLPRNPEFSTVAGQFSNMAVAQLKANVFFLQSQLSLAQALLETKSATIEALNFTIYQQKQLLIGSSADQSALNSTKRKDNEPVVGDTISVKPYEGKILRVDLPTILRRLKRSFGIGHQNESE